MEDGMGRVLPRKQKHKFKYTTEPVSKLETSTTLFQKPLLSIRTELQYFHLSLYIMRKITLIDKSMLSSINKEIKTNFQAY